MIFKRLQYNSPVVLSFTIICFVVYFISTITGNFLIPFLFSIHRTSITDPLMYIRLFTHIFGHQDISHYFNNMLLILLTGPMLEEKYGSKALIMMIMFTALITGLINIILYSNVALLGASGVVFMFILLSSFTNYKKGMIPATLIFCIVFFIGKEVFAGFSAEDNISHMTHIIGGICGAVFGFILNRDK